MHKIYFDDRSVTICSPDECEGGLTHDIRTLAEQFKSGAFCGNVLSCGTGHEDPYKAFCCEFKEVNAAGGLVQDQDGRYLLIRRNSVWDLPKGHQEKDEDIKETAMREVEEETGVRGLTLGDLILVTDHCYLRDGIYHLKHTWWFRMNAGATGSLTPQTEEGITEVVWADGNQLKECMENTYPTISDVFSVVLDGK